MQVFILFIENNSVRKCVLSRSLNLCRYRAQPAILSVTFGSVRFLLNLYIYTNSPNDGSEYYFTHFSVIMSMYRVHHFQDMPLTVTPN